MLGPSFLKSADSNSLIVIVLVALGYWFFVLAALNYDNIPNKKQNKTLAILALAVVAVLALTIYDPFSSNFFELQPPALAQLLATVGIILGFGILQYLVATRWFRSRLV